MVTATGISVLGQNKKSIAKEIRTELIRKSIHMTVALVPPCAAFIGRIPTLFLLAAGLIAYSFAEIRRAQGLRIPFITGLTAAAARPADFQDRVILGPITLCAGVMACILIYSETAAAAAIYALAFGDSLSSIVGKSIGKIRLPGMTRKTLEGSLACFFAVFFITLRMSLPAYAAVLVALTAAALEAVPVKDLDNLILPLGSGLAASLFLL
ncbi:MAG: phosphatidate cytidylyltransferase [Spirochaetales bacterium]|jgi:dolichol kinase|nr:phosphatidate cytidylyltransferase [Spirochaetales bacterium]